MKIALALLALSLAAQAQTAKVIELSPEDAVKAKSLYEQQVSIGKQIDDLKMQVQKKYLKPAKGETCNIYYSSGECYTSSWATGFEYSDDFRFIVPAKTPSAPTNCYGSMLTNCSFTSPFYTTTPFWGTTLANPVSGPVADSIVHGYTY